VTVATGGGASTGASAVVVSDGGGGGGASSLVVGSVSETVPVPVVGSVAAKTVSVKTETSTRLEPAVPTSLAEAE
jgi:hypothetical protein